MRKILVGITTLLLLALLALPALAQEGSSIIEVEPIQIDAPLPGTGTGTPADPGDPGTPARVDVTEVLGTPLARTGLDALETAMLGVGLVLAGVGAVLFARRRRAAGA